MVSDFIKLALETIGVFFVKPRNKVVKFPKPDAWEMLNMEYDSMEAYYPQWCEANPNWRDTIAEQRRVYYAELREKSKQTKVDDEKLQNLRVKIVNILKYFIWPSLIVSGLVISWLLYRTTLYVGSVFSVKDMVTACLVVLTIIVTYISVMALINVGKSVLAKWSKLNQLVEPKTEPEKEGFVIRGIGAFFEFCEFIWETIMITYHKKCPMLVIEKTQTKKPNE